MNKYAFSREDFLMYEGYFRRKLKKSGVKDIENKSVNQKHDKSFKDILVNKEEMSKFLEQFLKIKTEAENLEEQKNSFINKKFERRESDIIYKIKDKDIYILIEHQSKVDKRMPIRILEYCMEIMLALEKNKKNCEENPIIIPVVIYTGANNWTVATNFSDTQKVDKVFKRHKINLSYKLIDIKKYSKEELINKDTKMASMMLIEKCTTREELIDVLIELRNATENKERINWMKKIIEFVLADVLKEKKGEILNIIGREEKEEMDEWIERVIKNDERREKERIRKLKKEGRKEGREEGKLENLMETIRNMLKYNENEEKIMLYTNAKKEDIEKVKKELETQCNKKKST